MSDEKITIKTVLLSALALIVLVLGVAGISIYGFGAEGGLVSRIARIVPFPAVIVGQRKWITIDEFAQNSRSVRQFYENQDFSQVGLRVDFGTAEGKKRLKVREKEVLLKMVENQAIVILAQQEGIRITRDDLEKNVDQKLDGYGNRNSVEEEIRRLYGWTIEDFKDKIVEPALYREKLEEIFLKKYQDTGAGKKKIDEAEGAISRREKSFSDVVAEFSEGSTAQTGGELGWFKKSQISPEIADQIFSLEKGERSPILESRLGFHIVEMEERKSEEGEDLVRIRQVFAAKKTFPDWIGEQMKKMRVWIMIRGYDWNESATQVDFSDQAMREFEKKMMEDPQGDASVIF